MIYKVVCASLQSLQLMTMLNIFISEREVRYEPIIKFKDQDSEEGHTNALLFADVMDPPQIRKDKRTWPLGHLTLSKFIASVTQRKKTIDL